MSWSIPCQSVVLASKLVTAEYSLWRDDAEPVQILSSWSMPWGQPTLLLEGVNFPAEHGIGVQVYPANANGRVCHYDFDPGKFVAALAASQDEDASFGRP